MLTIILEREVRMKLARPDIFHPRIVLAGDPQAMSGDGGCADDAGLISALRNRALHARWLSWDDPDTLRADLVILRATRDLTARSEEFGAWTRQVRNLLNPPDAVAWNADRRYLRDLQHAGLPTGSQHASGGATALVFFGGAQSHAFGAGGTEPDFELWDLGHAALRAATDRLGIGAGELLYARADVVGEPGDVRLVSLDLIAPQLGWCQLGAAERDGRQRQFALCVQSALDRLGLGPLSHRGP